MAADLFFDLDRTLWDFDRNSREALAQIYAAHAERAWFEEWGAYDSADGVLQG